MAWMVTIDNGSTFTDGCLLADGCVHAVKVLTTPYDLMRCLAEVFRSLATAAGLPSEAELLRRVEEVRYSTTSGTNALLVRKGVRVGLIVDSAAKAELYGLRRRAPDLVEAMVGERVAALTLGEAPGAEMDQRILAAIRELLGAGSQWIVVSLPEPSGGLAEAELKRRYMRLLPGHLLGAVPVLFSRELCNDPDDERRTATALLNGFLHRAMARFLYHADNWVRERHVAKPLRIMRNDGGCGRVAKTTALKTLDSGPMGGLAGAGSLAGLCCAGQMVTVDVGGTSADIGVVDGGRPIVDLFGAVHDLPLSFSFPRLRTAALGGGSIFRVVGAELRIGPESAGALPGPVCFGRGGEHPTLTDAALIAGYLDERGFAGGAIELRKDLAAGAIAERVAAPLGRHGADAGASAMIDAFASGLAAEIAGVIERRGWKADATALVTFGGSGPLLACLAAERIGLRRLIVPPAAASFSALGVGFAELAHEFRGLLATPVDEGAWRAPVDGLRERSEREMYGEAAESGSTAGEARVRGERDGREVLVGAALDRPAALGTSDGRVAVDYRVRVAGSGLAAFPSTVRTAMRAEGGGEREVLIAGARQRVAVVDPGSIDTGASGAGPVLLETPHWSAIVPEGWGYAVREFGLELSRR